MPRPHPLRTPHGLHTSACRYHTRRTHQSTGGQRLQLRLGEPRRTCMFFKQDLGMGVWGTNVALPPEPHTPGALHTAGQRGQRACRAERARATHRQQ
jgi:hypothetical protein